MKKTILMITMLLAGVISSYAVDYTAKAYIKMNDATFKLRESTSYTAGPNTSCISNPNEGTEYEGVSAYVNSMVYNQWSVDELEGLQLSFRPTATDVTFNFSNVTGTQLYLVDANDGSRTPIVESGSYSFSVEASKVGERVADRFSISKLAVVEPTICHQGGKLIVTNYAGETKLDGNTVLTGAGEYNITEAAGYHEVEFNGQTMKILVP